MSEPKLFKIEQIGDQTSLYVSELSTCEALEIFGPGELIAVTELGAITNGANDWISERDLPVFRTVGEVIGYLNANERLDLIDFSSTIAGDNYLSTHDDGESKFIFPNKTKALCVLEFLLGKSFPSASVSTVLESSGKYVLLSDSSARVFATFDEYVRQCIHRAK